MRVVFLVPAGLLLGGSLAIPVARADDLLLLACYGEMRTLGLAGVGQEPEKYSLSIVIDQQAKTIKVGDYDPLPFLEHPYDPQHSTVQFTAGLESKYGVSSGALNRTTGAASIHIHPTGGGVLGFEGACKP